MPIEPTATPPVTKTRALLDVPEMASLAIQLLHTNTAVHAFNADDARAVLPYLRLVNAPRGAQLFVEGDRQHNSHMLLILEGEVSVDVNEGPGAEQVPVSVVGPGQLLGELALLDDAPRSATCVAVTDVRAAGLSRQGLQQLIEQQPRLGAHLMLAIAQRVGERLRALGDQLRLYSRLVADQQDTIHRLRAGR